MKEGVVLERTPHQGWFYRCLPQGARKESAPLKGSKDGQDTVNWTPIQTVGGELRLPHEALPALRVYVYDARSEYSVARATKNTDRKIKAELAEKSGTDHHAAQAKVGNGTMNGAELPRPRCGK